jgi:benzoate-CoA ligase
MDERCHTSQGAHGAVMSPTMMQKTSSTEEIADVSAPPERFNFADFLLTLNRDHPSRIAVIDDTEQLSYGALDQRVRRMASGLRALGLRREERVLLAMHDSVDWPVAFLGALYAGVVPVAVNTLLTADDYAFMLEHSRAQAVLVSAPLLPVLRAALVKSDHEVRAIVVSRADHPLAPEEHDLALFLARHSAQLAAATTHADEPAFWLYSSGSTGRPKGTVHSHANPYWAAQLYGLRVLGIRANDVCFSAAKLFFAYGLGNAMYFPMAAGATALLMAERPTADAVIRRLTGGVAGIKPTVFFGAPTGYAGLLASPALPAATDVALRLASSAGEALPAEIGSRFREHFAISIVDGIGSTEMLHIFISNRPDCVRDGTSGWPVHGYEIELRDESGQLTRAGEIGDLYVRGPSAALMYWGNRRKTRDTFQGSWVRTGDKYVRNDPTRGGARSRRHRRARRKRSHENQGVCCPEGQCRGDRRRLEGVRQRSLGTL